jgi:hypothetical protein
MRREKLRSCRGSSAVRRDGSSTAKFAFVRGLNAPFTLWILSAAFISGGSWLFALWDTERKAERTLVEKLSRLDDEVKFRLLSTGVFAAERVTFPEDSDRSFSVGSRKRAKARADMLLDPPPRGRSLYPEHAERGLISLLREIELSLRSDRASALCVNHAANLVAAIQYRPTLTDNDVRRTTVLALSYRWGPREPEWWDAPLGMNDMSLMTLMNMAPAEFADPDELTPPDGPCTSASMQAIVESAKRRAELTGDYWRRSRNP